MLYMYVNGMSEGKEEKGERNTVSKRNERGNPPYMYLCASLTLVTITTFLFRLLTVPECRGTSSIPKTEVTTGEEEEEE